MKVPHEEALAVCYERLHHWAGDAAGALESWQVVRQAAAYRNYWRPETVRVLLFGESHSHTIDAEWRRAIDPTRLALAGYPQNFVRFVYSLHSACRFPQSSL